MEAFLENLFNEIRKDPKITDPGLASYFEVVKVLRDRSFKLQNFEDIVFLLESCWLKSTEEQARFRELIASRQAGVKELANAFLQYLVKRGEETGVPTLATAEEQPAITKMPTSESGSILLDEQNLEEPEAVPVSEFGSYQLVFGSTDERPQNKLTVNRPAEQSADYQNAFIFTNDYLPVKSRQLQQAWRTLHSDAQSGQTEVVDVARTVNYSAKQGYFSDFLYFKKNENQVRLFLFMDVGAAMLAEEEMGEELLRTARESFPGNAIMPCYFQNTPVYDEEKKDWCFTDKNGLDPVYLKRKCFGVPKKNAAALVYSEAGAFRGGHDSAKLTDTSRFVDALYGHMRSVTWINPAPKSRWQNEVCAYLAGQVAMFDTSRTDVEKAIASLKGKHVLKTKLAYAAPQN